MTILETETEAELAKRQVYQTYSNLLKNEVLIVSFTKKNGERRVMRCTLRPDLLPQVTTEEVNLNKRHPNHESIAAFDLDKQDWRSFRFDSVTIINVEVSERVE